MHAINDTTSHTAAHTQGRPTRNLPQKRFRQIATLKGLSRHSPQRQRAVLTCHNSNKRQTISQPPAVRQARGGHRQHPAQTHNSVAWSQAPRHPEFFPEQRSEIKEHAALDVIARMQRSTIRAESLTCPVETAYLSPSGLHHYLYYAWPSTPVPLWCFKLFQTCPSIAKFIAAAFATVTVPVCSHHHYYR